MNLSASRAPAASKARQAWYAIGIDLTVTLILWIYFIAGFAVLFGPFYLLAALLPAGRERSFQQLTHLFFRGFFLLCRSLMPKQRWHIDPAIRAVRSSVVVCNHISYIDTILLISLFGHHSTIVKNRLLGFPVLNWVMMLAGYLPAASEGGLAERLAQRLEGLPAFFAAGGNLIVFPEGTRSRTGAVGPLNPGAFKLSRLAHAPIVVLKVRNTNRLFTPDRFLFNTWEANTITLELLARLEPEFGDSRTGIKAMMDQVRRMWEGENADRGPAEKRAAEPGPENALGSSSTSTSSSTRTSRSVR